MQKTHFSLLVGLSVFLFTACSDSNPTNFYAESSSSETLVSSSNIISVSSSSEVFSSSLEINSSSSFSSPSSSGISYGELIDDRDGQVYKTIKIGEQIWMAENLNYAYLQPTSTKDSSSECYNNELENCTKFGRLYLWSAAMDSAGIFSLDGKGCGAGSSSCKTQPSKGVRGICPENWHIPTASDMKKYIDYANSSIESLYSVKHYWIDGKMIPDFLQDSIGQKHALLWSSVDLYGETLNDNIVEGVEFTKIDNLVKASRTFKWASHSIRCVKDSLSLIHVEHGEMTDERDGQVYKTVKIGNQWWMAENLNYAYTKPTPQYYYGTSDIIDSASFCYNNEPDSCAKYGRLYTWEANMDCVNAEIDDYLCPIRSRNNDFKIRGVCPDKWHVPSVNEWKSLQYVVNYFATDLKSTEGWLDNGNGSDVVGFRILPTGYYINYLENFEFNFAFEDIGKKTCFWTLRQETIYPDCPKCAEDAYPFCISSNSKDFSFNKEPKIYAFPVRCVKDN